MASYLYRTSVKFGADFRAYHKFERGPDTLNLHYGILEANLR